jgi:flagellar basal body-associated protein FliL
MSRRENEANAIFLLLLFAVLFMVLVAGSGVFVWLQSLRAIQMRDEAERVELRAKAEAIQATRDAELSRE